MALLTIAEGAKHYNNPLAAGVAATIVEQNPFMGVVPFIPIAGDTIKYNWEATMGGAAFVGVNAAIPAGALDASAVTQKFVSLSTITAQANIDRLVRKSGEAAGQDPMAYEIASKAKNLGMKISNNLFQGSETNGVNSLKSQVGVEASAAGAVVSANLLDDLINLLQGPADFITMGRADLTTYKRALRTLGGNTEQVIIQDPFTGAERAVLAYEGIPIFINDAQVKTEMATGVLPNEGSFTAATKSSIYAGRWDDGSRNVGVAMLNLAGSPAGIEVEDLGALEASVAHGKRIVMHTQFVNFAKFGLARLYNVG